MEKASRIYVAGHQGLVGSAIIRKLKSEGFNNLLIKTHLELDLERQKDVEIFFRIERPEYVFLAAAKVGGISANLNYPGEFIYSNLIIAANVIHSAYQSGVKRLLFLGSSCIYPRESLQPIKEEYLLSGYLEPTNEPYAVAKIAGLKLCEAYNRQYGTKFISVMPTNLYGPNDNFDLENSHVLPAMIRKFHEAKIRGEKKVILWGTGSPRREFLHVNDLADACCFLMHQTDELLFSSGRFPLFNIGWGQDVTIKELAAMVKEITGFNGEIIFDESRPDGTPRKLLNISRIQKLGWEPKITLREGIKLTYEWYKANIITNI